MSEATVTTAPPISVPSQVPGPPGVKSGVRWAIAACFFLSGGAGLVYEVVWAKHLALFLGSTGLSHTIILAAFMGGLALGSWVIGRSADRVVHPLRRYAILELGIGCYGIFYPAVASVLEWGYFQAAEQVGIGGVAGLCLKLLLSAALLIPPTFLMGGTLPLLGRFLSRSGGAARAVSVLYFLNSFGAVGGTLLGGFLLIPAMGLRTSTILTGWVNLVAAAVALIASLRTEGEAEAVDDPRPQAKHRHHQPEMPPLGARDRLLLWGISASGFVGMVYELGWVRYFTQILGSSSHSFTLMLAAFISGITLGGLAAMRWLDRARNLRLLFAVLELSIGVAVLVPLLGYERFPYWFWRASGLLQRTDDAYQIYLAGKYLFAFVVMLIPTFFFGVTLPAVTAQLARRGQVGAQIGLVYAGNTVGTVAGALTTGFVFLPLLGIQWTLKLGVLLNLGIAAMVLWRRDAPAAFRQMPESIGRKTALGACAAAALVAVALPGWDPRLLAFGVYRRTEQAPPSFSDYQAALSGYRVTFAEEATDARVLVVDSPDGITSLVVNGKSDASNGSDMSTQMLIGHIPMLFHRDPRDALVIGLGSGVTAGSVLSHRPSAPVDCVEILPSVARAARYFDRWNNGVLDDPGLHLVIDDAKSFIRASRRHYDVIVSEPTNPWIAGVGNLFSTDFYRDCLDHLREGGLMVQFFHTYEMSDDLVRVMARTFVRSFPHVYTFNTGSAQADFILLGSRTPLSPDFERMQERLLLDTVKRDLGRIGVGSLTAILALQSHSPETLIRFGSEGRLNTDDLPIFENEGPRAFFSAKRSEALGRLDERRGTGEKLFIHDYLRGYPAAAQDLRSLAELFRVGVVENQTLLFSALREYLERAPGDLEAWTLLVEEHLRAGKAHGALSILEEARKELGGDPEAELRLLRLRIAALRPIEKDELTILSTKRAFPRTRECLERCLVLDPASQDLYFTELAKLSVFEADRVGAARWISKALRFRQENPARASPQVKEEELQFLKRWAAGAGS